MGVIGGEKGVGTEGGAGEGSAGARVWTHSATSVTEEVCLAQPSEVYRRVGTQLAWRWGPKRRRGGLEGGDCGGVVMKGKGVLGVV